MYPCNKSVKMTIRDFKPHYASTEAIKSKISLETATSWEQRSHDVSHRTFLLLTQASLCDIPVTTIYWGAVSLYQQP